MPYEVNMDDVMETIGSLLAEEIDASANHFDTYKTVIAEMTVESGTSKEGKKRKRKVFEASKKEQGEGFGKPSKVEEGKGKELVVVKTRATKHKKVVIEPKVHADLKKNVQEMVTPQRPKGKVIITRKRLAQPPAKLLPWSPSKKIKLAKVQAKPRRKMIVAQEEEEDEENTKSDETNYK